MNQKTIFTLIISTIIAGVIVGLACGGLLASLQVSNNGQINAVGIGVYSDASCTVPLTSLNWNVDQGSAISHIVYLKEVKNSAVTLSFTTSNWISNPTNSTNTAYLSWNAPTTLGAGQSTAVTFTLTAPVTIDPSSTFSFSTTITATKN